MNGLGKQKTRAQTMNKTVKINVKKPPVNKKPLARKQLFVQIPIPHSTLKFERNLTPKKHSRFPVPA